MSLDNPFTTIKEIPVQLHVIAAIWGHGGLTLPETNTRDDDGEKMDVVTPPPPILSTPIKIFQNKYTNLELNILGFAPSGFCTIGSKDTEKELDTMLTNDPTTLTPSFLTNMYSSESKKYRERVDIEKKHSTLITTNPTNLFSYVKNFGNKREKPRSDKIFSGASSEEELQNRINGLTTKGPLLKIYQVLIKNTKNNTTVYRDNEVKFVPYNKWMYLSEITDSMYTYCTEFLQKSMFYRNYTIVIDLFDPLCNYTESTPLIGYLENANTRRDFTKGNIKITPGIKYSSGGKTRRKQKKIKTNKNRRK